MSQTDFEKVRLTDNADVNTINKWLLATYGEGPNERPIFRVCFSNDLVEKRIGDLKDPSAVMEHRLDKSKVTEVLKYNYLPDRWILEKIVYAPNQEIAGSKYCHYEPVYVFQDKDCNYLAPNRKVCELILNMLLKGEPMSKEDWANLDEKAKEREIDLFEQILGEDLSDFRSSLREGSSILNAYQKEPSEASTPTSAEKV